MKALFALAKPALHAFDPEDAHKLTIQTLKHMPVCGAPHSDPMLQQELFGVNFVHPLGLAAGFDKNAEAMRAMLSLGMGHVEIGTVTVKPQDGNPRPRVFRDAGTSSVINRMGFPNGGADLFFKNLAAFRQRHDGVIGVNIGKNKDQDDAIADYRALAKRALGLADYVTINISSPNTPGLRDLQNGDFVRRCLDAVKEVYGGPVLVKLAPDLNDEQLQDLATAVLQGEASGVILTNTTLDRPSILPTEFAQQAGGLSGALLRDKSLDILRRFRRLTNGKVVLIAAGGVSSAEDAYSRIRAGAHLVQLYTAMVFKGPAVINEIVQGLPALLRRDGFETLQDAIGVDVR